MFTTRRGLLAPQNTFLENITRRCDGQYSSFILANARILDYPIVYTSIGFTKLTGFNRIEVLQQPCLFPFLRGPQTQKSAITLLESGILNNKSEQAEVIIYKKNCKFLNWLILVTPCWALIRVTPVRNEKESVILILVTFKDLSLIKQPIADDVIPGSGFATIASQAEGNNGWDKFARLVAALMRQKSNQTNDQDDHNGDEDAIVEDINRVSDEEEKKVLTSPSSLTTENLMLSPKNSTVIISPVTQSNLGDQLKQIGESPISKSTSKLNTSQKSFEKESIKNIEVGFSPLDQNIQDGMKKMGRKSKFKSWLTSQQELLFYGSGLHEKSGIFGAMHRTANLHGEFDDYLNQHIQNPITVPRYRPEPPRPPKHVLLHYSIFRIIWDWIILLLTGYTIVVVPVRILILPKPLWIVNAEKMWSTSFESPYDVQSYLAITDTIIDVTFIVDIILNFHTSFVGPGGEVISDSSVIKMNYLRGWFIFDLISCFPYEHMRYFGVSQKDFSFEYLRLIRLLRLVRAGRRIDQYMEHVSALLILMIVCFFILAHWFACCWYAIGISDVQKNIRFGWIPRIFNDSLDPYDWSNFNSSFTYTRDKRDIITRIGKVIEKSIHPNGNFTKLPLINLQQKWTTYLTALYFSLSLLTTIGFGNVAAFTEVEKAVSIFFMLIGALVYATIFGNITTIVQQMYSTRTRYNEMMKGVRDFLKIHDVPGDLSERVIDYVTSSWAITKGIDTAKVLNYCPKDMQADLSVHLNRCVFNIHPAFRLASDGCLRSLAVNFQTLHTAPGDLVIHQGESVDQLSFIVSGSLEVIQDDEVIALLGKGDVFGSPNWKNANQSPSAVSVRALTYCNLHTIRLDRLKSVLNFYHAFANSFTRNLNITYNLCNRFIFRKLVDVKHELELAEKRRKGPISSGLPVDHPVRKMISKLRRSSISTQDSANANWNSQYSSDQQSLTNSICEDNIIFDDKQTTLRKISPAQERSDETSKEAPSWMNTSADLPKDSSLADNKSKGTKYKQISPWISKALNSRGPAYKWARLLTKAQQNSLHNLQEEMDEDQNSSEVLVNEPISGTNTTLNSERILKEVNLIRDRNYEKNTPSHFYQNQIHQKSMDKMAQMEDETNSRFDKLENRITKEFEQVNLKFDRINENLRILLESIQSARLGQDPSSTSKTMSHSLNKSIFESFTSSQSTNLSSRDVSWASSTDRQRYSHQQGSMKLRKKYLSPPELVYNLRDDSSFNIKGSQEARESVEFDRDLQSTLQYSLDPTRATSKNPITLQPPTPNNSRRGSGNKN